MNFLLITQLVSILAALFCIGAFAMRVRRFLALTRPGDRSQPRGDVTAGVRYALTLGMMPWAKESTRRHALSYMRGVGFHLVVALSFGVFLASPWLALIPAVIRLWISIIIALGSLLAFLGFVSRLVEKGLRALSLPDDYFAILLVSLYLGVSALAVWNLALLPWFHLTAAVLFVYMPLGKIRHCIYFAFSRMFFGRFFGRRGIYPHSQQEVAA